MVGCGTRRHHLRGNFANTQTEQALAIAIAFPPFHPSVCPTGYLPARREPDASRLIYILYGFNNVGARNLSVAIARKFVAARKNLSRELRSGRLRDLN